MVRGDRARFQDRNSSDFASGLKTTPAIDREKICPFLLRVFCRSGSHHSLPEFDLNHVPEKDEIQLYSWKNATLGELTSILKDVHGKDIRRDNVISFKVIYYDYGKSEFRAKDVGAVVYGRHSPGEGKCLDQLRFVIGDYLSVAILPPQPLVPVSTAINAKDNYGNGASIRGLANRSRRESLTRDQRAGPPGYQTYRPSRRFADRASNRARDRPRSPYRRKF
ncbi:Histone deacetylase complex subunit sap18 [Entomophthora muscae]|uniref:Histone deacetylase complex subunit sap18 n=1 Tax=Entomophthora muscae TaxID=34485 RepID=A0ACC2URR2_9FUNG|nr:Histone deacetylase complex subunit sap18 [Entomophthora muscae]